MKAQPILHFLRNGKPRCPAHSVKTALYGTTNPAKVTCKNCLRLMGPSPLRRDPPERAA